MMNTPAELINTKYLPPYYGGIRLLARMSRAYNALAPYPAFSPMTKDWKTEERGPFPRCLPFVQDIVNKGISWLFENPLAFRVGDDNVAADTLNQIWAANDMTRRSTTVARTGALSGGCVLKWSYTKDQGPKIHILDPAEQTRLYWDSLDQSKLLMARIQFPQWNAKDGLWYWYREDWTDEELVIYKMQPSAAFSGIINNDPYSQVEKVDVYDNWTIDRREKNAFGIIPLWYIKNKETGTEYGQGDLWQFYQTVDLINFTRDLAHKDNQKSIDPDKAFIDLMAGAEEQGQSDGPIGERVLQTTDDAKSQGKIEVIQTNAALRPHVDAFADKLLEDLYATTGMPMFNPSEITNKGNLTSAVLVQLYAPTIKVTNLKRNCYGEDGICVFLERMSQGLTTAKVTGWKPMPDIQAVWGPYFEQTEEEKMELAQRQAFLVENNFTTFERAIGEVAKADDVPDVNKLKNELIAQKEAAEAQQAADQKTMMSEFERAKRGMGG